MSTFDETLKAQQADPRQTAMVEAGSANAYDIGAPIDVRQDRTTILMVGFFGALIVCLLAGLWFGQFAKQETVRGYVSASTGLTRILTPRAGVIATAPVKEGDQVEAGQIILSVDVVQVSAGGASTADIDRASLTQRQAALKTEIEKILSFTDKTDAEKRLVTNDAQAVLAALDRQDQQVKRALDQEEDGARKMRQLVRQGFATREKLDVHQRAAREYARQASEIAVKRTELRRETSERLRAIEALLSEKSNARTQFENELSGIGAQLGQNSAETRVDIRAPRAGRLAALAVGPGTSVSPGQFVAAIGDAAAGDLVVVLDAPSGAIGLAEPGQRVVLKYDAFPYKSFGVQRGTILSVAAASNDDVSAGAAGTGAMPAEARLAARQSSFRILVKPDSTTVSAYGADRPIKLGSTLTADITVERRRLIDWAIDPILALRGRS